LGPGALNPNSAHNLNAKPLIFWRDYALGDSAGLQSRLVGQIMSGVVAAMRRTLLSCTSLARHGLIALASVSAWPKAALADDLTIAQTISGLFDLNHQ
jgi:hypothetical protein